MVFRTFRNAVHSGHSGFYYVFHALSSWLQVTLGGVMGLRATGNWVRLTSVQTTIRSAYSVLIALKALVLLCLVRIVEIEIHV